MMNNNGDISVTSKAFSEFVKQTDENFKAVRSSIDAINLSTAERRYKDKVVENNERAVDDHEKRISKLEDRVKLILWGTALIITPLLLAIGAGILRLLQEVGH
jgi:hypothetical protein